MNKKYGTSILITLILFISLISISCAQEIATNKVNFISEFMEKTISNPALNIIGIKETVSTKELIITLLLILIIGIIIFEMINFADLLGTGADAITSIILVLIGSQTGIPLKIAKEMLTIKDALEFLVSNKWTVLIIVAVLVVLTLLAKPLKKTILKTKELEEEERLDERKRKKEKLEKIVDYKTDLELKRYGAD
jgi:hypothetical protein